MRAQLKYEGIRVFLEQTQRYNSNHETIDECRRYGNVLFVNSLFSEIARRTQKVYQLNISQFSTVCVGIWFGDCPSRCAKTAVISTERIRQILLVLRPQLVIFHYDTNSPYKPVLLLDLIQLVSGKTRLTINRNFISLSVVERCWNHLNELDCNAHLLPKIHATKQFDKLIVYGINENNQLNAALRQPVKQLELRFLNSFDGFKTDDAAQFTSTETTKCRLTFLDMWQDFNQVLAVAHKIVAARPRMSLLKIDCIYNFDKFHFSVQVDKKMLQLHGFYIKLVKMLFQLAPFLRIDLDFCLCFRNCYFNMSKECQQELNELCSLGEGSAPFWSGSKLMLTNNTRYLKAAFCVEDENRK